MLSHYYMRYFIKEDSLPLHHLGSLLEKCKSKLQWVITSHPSEWPSSKSLQTINAGECVEEKEPSYCYVNWYNRYGEQYGGPLKTKTTIWSSNLIPGWVWMCVCRYIHSSVQCSSIYSSQDLETTYISIYRGMDKEDVCGTCIQ